MQKYPKTGCLVIASFLFFGLVAMVCTRPGSRGYLDSAYEKDYQWQDIEVGTILRLPIGSIIPTGRKMAVIAFPSDNMEGAHILYESGGGELPTRPLFVSATNSTVTYQIPATQGEVTIDLANLAKTPLRTATSPKPILTEMTKRSRPK